MGIRNLLKRRGIKFAQEVGDTIFFKELLSFCFVDRTRSRKAEKGDE